MSRSFAVRRIDKIDLLAQRIDLLDVAVKACLRIARDLAEKFPFIDFFPVEGANHVSVLFKARDTIIRWMNNWTLA